MQQENKVESIQPEILSIGGAILCGVIFFCFILLIAAYQLSTSLGARFFLWVVFLAALLYLAESLRETLTLTDQEIIFSRWHRPAISLTLTEIQEMHLLHEGLNLEHGIESLILKMRDGSEKKWPLGPLWRKRRLERFLQVLEHTFPHTRLVEEM